jgi:hypothetical protein
MGIGKRRTRPLVLGSNRFRWRGQFNDPELSLSAELFTAHDALLVRPEEGHHRLLTVFWRVGDRVLLTPGLVRACVEEAIRRGWLSEYPTLSLAGVDVSTGPVAGKWLAGATDWVDLWGPATEERFGPRPAAEVRTVARREATPLAAAERLSRLHRPFPAGSWMKSQFAEAAREGGRRWSEAEELFGLQWPMFQDAVSVISPSFILESHFTTLAEATDIPARRNVNNRITLWFMRWARCPLTAEYPNPYEPWVEIWENGGSISFQHGYVVDVYDASGMPAGSLAVRRV